MSRGGRDLTTTRELARDHIRDIIEEKAGERPESPGLSDDVAEAEDWGVRREEASDDD